MTLRRVRERAATRVLRLAPAEAWAALGRGEVLVDTRSASGREHVGVVPGSFWFPRTVLEWRLEPGGNWRNPFLPEPLPRIVVLCEHGYSSLLAAESLWRMGLESADVLGGAEAWAAAGLPLLPACDPPRPAGGLEGMAPPAAAVGEGRTTSAGDGRPASGRVPAATHGQLEARGERAVAEDD